jgi:hypothetical protein
LGDLFEPFSDWPGLDIETLDFTLNGRLNSEWLITARTAIHETEAIVAAA